MIVMTETTLTEYAQKIVDFLMTDEETRELSTGDWVAILGAAQFYLGVMKGCIAEDESLERE